MKDIETLAQVNEKLKEAEGQKVKLDTEIAILKKEQDKLMVEIKELTGADTIEQAEAEMEKYLKELRVLNEQLDEIQKELQDETENAF